MSAASTANNYELEPLNHSEHHKFNNNSRESKICDGKSKYLIIIGILTILIIIAITLGTTVSLSKSATTINEESQNIRFWTSPPPLNHITGESVKECWAF